MTGHLIGTAGHIDHGKTALVAALTGEDTDRLPEERRRGISIDLGFSHLDLGDGAVAGVVDVPGHEDFIRNMVAGATGIDLLLLVVAADEGVMPQTREHVAIAALLGVPRAVVALTKTDLVEEEWLALAVDDVATFLAGTPFRGAEVVPVSATTGAGLDALRATLAQMPTGRRGEPDDLFRLPVDRAFTVHGTGTVVTGTVWSGSLERERRVRLLPGEMEARVRGLQVHGREVDRVEAGQRAALALAGLDRQNVVRGVTVVADDVWHTSSGLTVRLSVLPDTDWVVDHGQRVRVHVGTAEVMARVGLLDAERLEGGAEGWARLRLEAPLVARTGDRVVMRSYSPVTTIGGGVVVEVGQGRRSRRLGPGEADRLAILAASDPGARVHALLDAAGSSGLDARALALDAGVAPGTVPTLLYGAGGVVIGGKVFPGEALVGVRERLLESVADHHRRRPLQTGMDSAELRRVAADGADAALVEHALADLIDRSLLRAVDGRVAHPEFRPTLDAAQERRRDEVLSVLAERQDGPPRVDALRERLDDPPELLDLLELMEREGRLVRVEADLFMEAHVVERMVASVRSELGGRSGVSPAEFRAVLGLSRRDLIPILEYLDRQGVTTRTADGRSVAPAED